MNHKDTVNLTPTGLGRLLALHGRASTACTLPVQNKFDAEECMRQLRSREQGGDKASGESGKKHAAAAAEGGDVEGGKGKDEDEAKPDGKRADCDGGAQLPSEGDGVKARDQMPPPQSKDTSGNKDAVQPSYSFYRRGFRVKGDNAWEYAMRDLGSVDTLFNRYGYVPPGERLDTASSSDMKAVTE